MRCLSDYDLDRSLKLNLIHYSDPPKNISTEHKQLLRIFIYEILYNDVSSTRYVLNQVSFTSALYMHYFISNKQFDHLRNTVQ